jgi:hypothetical protein
MLRRLGDPQWLQRNLILFSQAHGFSRDKRDYERHLLLSRLGEPLTSAPSIISQRAMNKSAFHNSTD